MLPGNRFGRPLAVFEHGRVGAFREGDLNLIVFTLGAVIQLHSGTETGYLDAGDGIDLRVEARRAPEHRDREYGFLELGGSALEGLLDEEAQEARRPLPAGKSRTRQDFGEFVLHVKLEGTPSGMMLDYCIPLNLQRTYPAVARSYSIWATNEGSIGVMILHSWIAVLLLFSPALLPAQGKPLVFRHIGVVDVAAGRVRPDQTVVLRGSRIEEIGASARVAVPLGSQVIEGAGKFLIPGLADMHNHLVNPIGPPEDVVRFLGGLLPWGVTTVFSPALALGDYQRVKEAASGDNPNLPRFYGVGPAFSAPEGHMASFEHRGVEIPTTTEAARAEVRALKAASVEAVKVIFDAMRYAGRPGVAAMKPEVLAAILDEAHRQGLKDYAHASTLKYAKDFLRAGGDGLVHGIVDEPVDDEFLSLMKTGCRFYIATLTLMEAVHDIAGFVRREAGFDVQHRNPERVYAAFRDPKVVEQANVRFRGAIPEENVKIMRANLKRVASSGIPVATGTDTGVPGVLPGVASQLELVLFVEAGLSPAEALRASTLTAQRILGRERELGEIAVGKLADLVVLDGDPLADIHNIAKVNAVVKSGVLHYAGQLP